MTDVNIWLNKDYSIYSIVDKIEDEIDNMRSIMTEQHIERLENNECSPASSIFLRWGSKEPACIYAEPGQLLTSADLKLHKNAQFFRVNVYDENDRPASTRGYFRDEFTK